MVTTVKNKQESQASFFIEASMLATRDIYHLPVHDQRRGHRVTTVDQSDIRGLGTA